MSSSNDNAIEWEEPPAVRPALRPRPFKYLAFAEELRKRPDQWAVLIRGAKRRSIATRAKYGQGAFQPRGAFDARSVTVPDGFDIYVRFVGDPS